MIQIDVSRIPQDKQTRSDFLDLKLQMEQALSQKLWINAFCIHEAGHIIYLTQLGVTEYIYNGPRIDYNQKADTFDGFMASIEPQSKPDMSSISATEVLVTGPKAYAAGSVFAKQLTNAPDQGDQQDREHFNDLCILIEQIHGVSLDREALWRQAQDDVLKDLRSPAFRVAAWKNAREIQAKFGF